MRLRNKPKYLMKPLETIIYINYYRTTTFLINQPNTSQVILFILALCPLIIISYMYLCILSCCSNFSSGFSKTAVPLVLLVLFFGEMKSCYFDLPWNKCCLCVWDQSWRAECVTELIVSSVELCIQLLS